MMGLGLSPAVVFAAYGHGSRIQRVFEGMYNSTICCLMAAVCTW